MSALQLSLGDIKTTTAVEDNADGALHSDNVGQTAKDFETDRQLPDYQTKWQSSGLTLPEPPEIRNWLQTIGLAKAENYLLDPRVRTVRMGLAWDKGADIDSSVVLLDESLHPVDVVWYRKLESDCKSVVHSGDNVSGAGDGDDEVIKVHLETVPAHVHHMAFTVSVYTSHMSFNKVRNASVRMLHGDKKHSAHVLCFCRLSDLQGRSLVLAQLTRKGGYWNFRAIGSPASGRSVQQILQNARNLDCLRSCPSVAPLYRRISVCVRNGTNLAAKDRVGLFKKTATSDPYYIIRYRNNVHKSEHQQRTVNPVWKECLFGLGQIMESEMKDLIIAIFDYDFAQTDDFMGMVWVPVRALYWLGAGTHALTFELGPSKEKEYRHELVTGELHLDVIVEDVAESHGLAEIKSGWPSSSVQCKSASIPKLWRGTECSGRIPTSINFFLKSLYRALHAFRNQHIRRTCCFYF